MVEVSNIQNALSFEIEGRIISFSVSDFSHIMGFPYDEIVSIVHDNDSERGDIWNTYFPDCKTKVKRRDIKSVFQSIQRGRKPEENIVKLSLLYVLSHAFLAAEGQVSIHSTYLNLVDDLAAFNSYPWGRVIWDDMVGYFKASLKSIESNPSHYNVYGCVIALQVWAFESFPALKVINLAHLVDPCSEPSILKWSSTAKPSSESLKDAIFCNKGFLFTPISQSDSVRELDNPPKPVPLKKKGVSNLLMNLKIDLPHHYLILQQVLMP
ncbi:unnamed protein product, partial [Cuscuta europaea]